MDSKFNAALGIGGSGDWVTEKLISSEQIKRIAAYADMRLVESVIVPLNAVMHRYQINTPRRIAHFIAQLAHECDSFNTLEEYASGAAYEGRGDLGNTHAGDGVRFKGRGLIQVTGFYNYQKISIDTDIDFLNNPVWLEKPEYAALSAGWFWNRHGLNQHADNDNFQEIMYTINGGNNGEGDRWHFLQNAKKVLGIV